MTNKAVGNALATLFGELVEGAPPTGGYMLNRGDAGILTSLDRLSAEAASTVVSGGSSIAAHVDHLRYGLSLMNRWAAGEGPWDGTDWKASWSRISVSDAEWAERRAAFHDEARRWLASLKSPRDLDEAAITGMMGSVAHLAYHIGAIRQMDRSIRGPNAND